MKLTRKDRAALVASACVVAGFMVWGNARAASYFNQTSTLALTPSTAAYAAGK